MNISCNLETNICETTLDDGIQEIKIQKQEKVKVLYFTDPICSACWAIEPILKRLILEYGEYFEIEYKMGGLLPFWDGKSSVGGGMSSPSDLAHHWDEIGQHSGMSIDGNIWLEDPLNSSYPPSYAYLAMQNQGEDLAQRFLRHLREMLFLEKKNITKEKYLLEAAAFVNADKDKFLEDFQSQEVKQRLSSHLQDRNSMDVGGFPTLIFLGTSGYKISGIKKYDNFVTALKQAYGSELTPKPLLFDEYGLLKKYRFLATKEISTILGKDESNVLKSLELLTKEGKIQKSRQKWGDFWRFVKLVYR